MQKSIPTLDNAKFTPGARESIPMATSSVHADANSGNTTSSFSSALQEVRDLLDKVHEDLEHSRKTCPLPSPFREDQISISPQELPWERPIKVGESANCAASSPKHPQMPINNGKHAENLYSMMPRQAAVAGKHAQQIGEPGSGNTCTGWTQARRVHFSREAVLERRRFRMARTGARTDAPSTMSGTRKSSFNHPDACVQDRIGAALNVVRSDPRDIKQIGLNSFDVPQHTGVVQGYAYTEEEGIDFGNDVDSAFFELACAVDLLRTHFFAVSMLLTKWGEFFDAYHTAEENRKENERDMRHTAPEGSHLTSWGATNYIQPMFAESDLQSVAAEPYQTDRNQTLWDGFDLSPTSTAPPVPPSVIPVTRNEAIWGDIDMMLPDKNQAAYDKYSPPIERTTEHAPPGFLPADYEDPVTELEDLSIDGSLSEFDWNDGSFTKELEMYAAKKGFYTPRGKSMEDIEARKIAEANVADSIEAVKAAPSTIPTQSNGMYDTDTDTMYGRVSAWLDRQYSIKYISEATSAATTKIIEDRSTPVLIGVEVSGDINTTPEVDQRSYLTHMDENIEYTTMEMDVARRLAVDMEGFVKRKERRRKGLNGRMKAYWGKVHRMFN